MSGKTHTHVRATFELQDDSDDVPNIGEAFPDSSPTPPVEEHRQPPSEEAIELRPPIDSEPPLLRRVSANVDSIRETVEALARVVLQIHQTVKELQRDRSVAESLRTIEIRMQEQEALHRRAARAEDELQRVRERLSVSEQRAKKAEDECTEMKRQLHDAIRQKLPAGQFVSSEPNAGPSADEFHRSFEYIRTQLFETCVQNLLAHLSPRGVSAVDRSGRGLRSGAARPDVEVMYHLRNILASSLFNDESPDMTVDRIAEGVSKRFNFQLSLEHRRDLSVIAPQCLRLVRNAKDARPPVTFLFPKQGERFDPSRHEAARDGSDEPGDPITLVLFPGYGIAAPDVHIRVKARVLAQEPRSPAHGTERW